MYTEQEVFEKWFPVWFHMQCKLKGADLFHAGRVCSRLMTLIEVRCFPIKYKWVLPSYGIAEPGEWEDYCDMYLGIPHDDIEALHTLMRSVVRSAQLKEVQEGNTTYYKHYGT